MSAKVLAVTLARGGSKSVPKKNIKLLSGIPVIAHTIREALKSSLISRYVVSTDDIEIQKLALGWGAECPFLRPSELATDTASSVAALQHAVNWVEKEESIRYDYVVELMANPMKTVDDIDHCIKKLMDTADSVIAVHRLDDHHPARIKKIVDDRIVDFVFRNNPNLVARI